MTKVPFFDAAYEGTPPWDICRPQQEFVQLAEAGDIRGDVLDVGCGTGENALYLVERGHEVWGIDLAPKAIEKARAKAQQRYLKATFLVWDALELSLLERQFDTAIDCGLFHVLLDQERLPYANNLHAILRPNGTYFMLCFSERQPGELGPRRVTQAEIRATFSAGWQINYIKPAILETNLQSPAVQAWLASITRP